MAEPEPAGPRDGGLGLPDAGPAQIPPGDGALIRAWIDTGAYLAWTCETEFHPAAPPSFHGPSRICQNAIADAAEGGTGQWPPGTTFVKEQYYGDGRLFAISLTSRRSSVTGPAGWYFWRRQEGIDAPSHTGFGNQQRFCADCHTASRRDFVWRAVNGRVPDFVDAGSDGGDVDAGEVDAGDADAGVDAGPL